MMNKILKFAATLFIVVIFSKMFIFENKVSWPEKFNLFFVPAQAFPYGDIRNIQVAAYCKRRGYDIYTENECAKSGAPSSGVYKDIQVPALNYPPVWIRIYELFYSESEKNFQRWGKTNAWLLLLAIVALCFKPNYKLAPLFLFSPVVLLCVERGNIDGAVFAIVFLGLALARNQFSKGLVFMVAAGLKIFPIVGALAYFRIGGWKVNSSYVLGLAAGSVLLIEALVFLPKMLGKTTTAFDYSFGLMTFKHVPYFQSHPKTLYAFLALLVIGWFLLVFKMLSTKELPKSFADDIKSVKESDINLALTSLAIYLGTYLAFSNWAYRMIFIIPAVILASRFRHPAVRLLFIVGLFQFWMPVLSSGWHYFNVVATLLVMLCAPFLVWLVLARRMASKDDGLQAGSMKNA